MKIKMLKTDKVGEVEVVKDSIATVDDVTGKVLIEKELAIEYTEKIEEEEKQEALKKVLELKEQETIQKMETINMSIEVKAEAKPEFKSMGEFFGAVIKAGKTGEVDSRLMQKSTGQNETTVGDGGYTVSVDIAKYITQQVQGESVMLGKCSKLEIAPYMTGIKIPQVNESARSATTLYGGVRVYSPGEGVAKTAFKQAYTQKQIDLKKLCAVNYLTDELMQDNTALEGFIRNNVGKALAWTMQNEIINATLSAATAIVNHASTVEVTVAGNNPTAAEIAQMYAANINRTRAEWYISGSQYAAIIALATTGTFPLYQPNFAMSPMGTLLGRPINVIEQGGADTDESSFMFLDLSDYLIIGKGGVQEAMSIHVKFLEDETCLRYTTRWSGAPLMASKIQLPDGKYYSSFVTRD